MNMGMNGKGDGRNIGITDQRIFLGGVLWYLQEGLFADPDTIDDGTLYRINQDTGEVSLDYIGKVGVKAWRLPEY